MATPAVRELSLTHTVDVAVYDETLADKLWENLDFINKVYKISLPNHPRYWNPFLFWLRDYWVVKRRIDELAARTQYSKIIFSTIYSLPHIAYILFPFLLRRYHKIDQIAFDLGIQKLVDRKTVFHVPKSSVQEGEAFLSRHNIKQTDRIITIHALTTDQRRDLPLPSAMRLIERVAAQSTRLRFIILGTKGTYQEEWTRYQMHLQGDHVIYTYADDWNLDLLTCGYLIQRSSVFVGIDSGPFHMAGALGVNTIAVFRSSMIKSDQRKAANDNIVCFDGPEPPIGLMATKIAEFLPKAMDVCGLPMSL